MKLQDAIQRAREIQDASDGNTIPGDPDHGRWSRTPPPGTVTAEPVGFRPTPPSPNETAPGFNLPQRPLPPITVAPDSLQHFQRPGSVPTRRVIPPKPL